MRRPFLFRVWAVSAAVLTTSSWVGTQPRLATPRGPVDITMPDGSTVGGASNHLLLFFSSDATVADRDAVIAVIRANGAEVVGEIPEVQMLQVEVQDPATIGSLMIKLQLMKDVQFVGPDLFLGRAISACDGTGQGPIPSSGLTGWVQANNMADPPASANDVVIGVVDFFAPPGQAPDHGDVVTAYVRDSGGKGPSGTPLFDVGKNIFQIPAQPTTGMTMEALIRDLIEKNPGKKVILNMSLQPQVCVSQPESAACANAQNQWNKRWNDFMRNTLVKKYGNRVIAVGASGNGGVSVEPSTSLSSCNFIPVGGFDQTSPKPTLAPFSVKGAPIPVYAPACNISPLSLYVPPNTANSSGTSFAAPQVAGQLAAIWAANPGLNACQLGSQVFALPKVDDLQPGAQFNGRALAERASARVPASPELPDPLTPLACEAIDLSPASPLVLQASQTVQLSPRLRRASTPPTFKYLSSNPGVATVDATGLVTAKGPGVATVYVTAPDVLCAAQASIVVPSETYRGTFTDRVTASGPIPDCTPNPWTVTVTVASAPIQLVVAQSLLTSGTVAGFLTLGPGTVDLTMPDLTCKGDPPTTIPGATRSERFDPFTTPITGTSDGKILQFHLDGVPPLTGTVSVLGATVQVTLNLSFQESDESVSVSLQLNADLTKQ